VYNTDLVSVLVFVKQILLVLVLVLVLVTKISLTTQYYARHAWQSLAYSPLAVVVTRPNENAAPQNEHIYPHFAIKLVAMATSLEESEEEVQIVHIHANTYQLVKNGKIRSSGS